MIEATKACKRFGSIQAVQDVDLSIQSGEVFGLIGSNGAGKSTFLRMLSGIYKPDSGSVTIDGQEVFENTAVKGRCFYISDEQHFFANSTPEEMKNYYKMFYPNFDEARFRNLIRGFDLDAKRKIRTFSKGMKKQVSIILGVCANVDYLFCDETFDGLDPVARQAVKSLFAEDISERGITPIVASHNLRELEDICDHVGLLHKGGVLLSRDLESMKLDIHKVQCAFSVPKSSADFQNMKILNMEQRGSLCTIVARGSEEEILNCISQLDPIFCEILPLTLEEIFINETEVVGYDIKKLIF